MSGLNLFNTYRRHAAAYWRRGAAAVLLLAMGGCADEGMFEPGRGDNNTDNPGTGALPALARHASGFEDSHYSGSGRCVDCHDGLMDDAGTDVSIVQDWSSSMMANAARDPYWIARVAAEIDRNPALKNMLDDTCSRCHAPMANDVAKKTSIIPSLSGEDSMLNAANPLFDHAMEGVSCTLCHQMEDDGKLGTPEGASGNFSVQQYSQPSDRPAYGQYTDPSGALMLAQTQFNPVYGPHISTSSSCAACHDLKTPSVDASGVLIDTSPESFFPEQMVYSEWLASDFAIGQPGEKSCQACHMPEVSGSVMLATLGGGRPRQGFSRHSFLGANTVMQAILRDYRDELGISVEPAQFDASIARNRLFLQNAATITIASSSLNSGQLEAEVRIINQTGHKLPSGFPSRRVYVHFVVSDTSGKVVFESGKLAADGSIIGNAADVDSKQYENHYTTITSADQVQIYEAVMGDANAMTTHTLMRASHYLKDNRLLPAGFDKGEVSTDIAVAGLAAADSDFDAGGDRIMYRVPIPAAGSYTVRAELIYQPLAYGHLQDLFSSIHLPEVDQFKTMFDAAPLKAETIAVDTVTLP